jgi:hypothetical protein
MGIIAKMFGSGRKTELVERAIEHLAREGSIVGTAFKEISYRDVVDYIKLNNCRVISVRPKPRGDWIEFAANFRGTEYIVWLDKTFEGDGSVLTAKKAG